MFEYKNITWGIFISLAILALIVSVNYFLGFNRGINISFFVLGSIVFIVFLGMSIFSWRNSKMKKEPPPAVAPAAAPAAPPAVADAKAADAKAADAKENEEKANEEKAKAAKKSLPEIFFKPSKYSQDSLIPLPCQ